jgi:uncharacterized Ntn-hydrolase superfamily protein
MYRLPIVVTALALAVSAQKTPGEISPGVISPGVLEPAPETGTFSILGFDPDTGEIGAAVQSKVFSVGNGVLLAEAEVGAVATQAIVDVGYGPKAMAMLRQGMAPKAIIQKLLDDDTDPGYRGQRWQKAGRQMAVMNSKGEFAAYTGPEAPEKKGDAQGPHCTAQGNTLGPVDPAGAPATPTGVPQAMVDGFEKSATTADGAKNHISLRLVAALEAGQAAGGDRRGQQSAALIVVKKDCGVWLHNDVVLHLQVDDNPEPIKEMRRLVEKALVRGSGQAPCRR